MTIDTKTDLSWQTIRHHLEAKKANLYVQIGNYPTPITGCDQQFNHLLDEQQRVIRELARLDKAEQASLTTANTAQSPEQFARSSSYVIDTDLLNTD